jgi:F-type H+-transporting ATPase subunit epsilon
MSFQCTIVTPEQQALDEKAEQVVLPAHDGLMGILTDRAPLLVKLGVGPLRVDVAGGKQQLFLVDGGVAQMKDNKLTILTTTATPAAEISAGTARAEYAEAEAQRAADPKAIADRQHRMDRARAAGAIAGKN